MSFGIAQQGSTQGSTSPVSFTFSGAQSPGNANVIFIANDFEITAGTDDVTDNNGNVYSRVATVNADPQPDGSGIFGGLWVCPSINAASAGACTVQFSFAGTISFPEMWCVEASGGPFSLDTTHGPGGSAVAGFTAATSSTYTTGFAPDFLISYCFCDSSTNNGSQGAGWSQVGTVSPDGSFLQDITATPAGTFTASCTLSLAKWVQMIVALTASSTPPPPVVVPSTQFRLPLTSPVEGLVAIPPNQTMAGANDIRQFQQVVAQGQPQPTMTAVLVEAISQVDATLGRPLDLESQEWKAEFLWSLRALSKGLSLLCVAYDVEKDDDDNFPNSNEG